MNNTDKNYPDTLFNMDIDDFTDFIMKGEQSDFAIEDEKSRDLMETMFTLKQIFMNQDTVFIPVQKPGGIQHAQSIIHASQTYFRLYSLITDVQTLLRKEYDMSYYVNYSGLCNDACKLLSESIKKEFPDSKVILIHGEQKHSPLISSKHWAIEHTWIQAEIAGETWYLDPTSKQFQDIYPDIPDMYISTEKPKWYYSDDDNPSWNGITGKLNNLIRIPYKKKDEQFTHRIEITAFLQFVIWEKTSDCIRRLLRNDDKK